MDTGLDFHTAKALLEWQVELGVSEAIGDAPVNRYEEETQPVAAPQSPPVSPPADDPVAGARAAATAAGTLEALCTALAAFEGCDLKRGARSLVFADGTPAARVMVIGEAPGRDEDIRGKPFVGRAGQLLDKMFAAIGLGRDRAAEHGLYITNVLPWRPPQNRDPQPEEVAMMLPFLHRHIELAAPEVIVLMGNHSCGALLGRKGITRLRGNWAEVAGLPALPMFHPAFLLRNPAAKREAWRDLLMLQARLRGDPADG
ncbi:DNA polymerase [Rhodovulum imhoffii]|uniref:Type-4 uracil-DNA glycosylase n=1 Tax=Rhodovulum imhoffii TaxID=365340 RepID=A0A2T5BUE4_9RHOB|nr:uracil-DNA glycosylase [Rhodovulum imhoffii]MBK5934517.1 uracil-DNA glycosylase [Rhodovulum imhoffii]PTN03066.1 DNA polymerase [Rhodovulum imhoffii]